MVMSKLALKVIIGLDLAGNETNPTGWAKVENGTATVCQLYRDEEIIRRTVECRPDIIAIDAPLSMPKSGAMRKADREMHRRGYRVLPPLFPSMKSLTKRAVKIARKLREQRLKVIEVHPTSTRKALEMPTKDWRKIQTLLTAIGLKGNHQTRTLTPHEIDALTAALTGILHLQGKTQRVGDKEEGFIVVPKRRGWRNLNLWV